ncbi:hypothetical protein A3J90_08910 [candidate division WOR-1 bacterium RIFOXYC2_FULL_37_10]|uniref:Uncharacterized protein n=1 Tax=candidate division WOR-1 bacterium RIFOXYB2_FULL_37_13 TaxID=1802579 RepID=A0A1F4SUT6_UNCSA|nr:MAG: hypothetical protein A2246_03425 [candidate division WOR-1 bacterium RIFOXYA2_FULL_37_7]OGC24201.1 MAG: hypothetical protein A2310_06620 [candidate division WOR-1 bacterium RIFOXYB2_FULL_37_13]OGC36572.1 MAG: hypothetical protein A3J90_08910 [candidate division WOR-1 bacterium RIFOXYC2_FULL_37_10]
MEMGKISNNVNNTNAYARKIDLININGTPSEEEKKARGELSNAMCKLKGIYPKAFQSLTCDDPKSAGQDGKASEITSRVLDGGVKEISFVVNGTQVTIKIEPKKE